jgi:phosphoserine phosphatase RsbU/P
MSILVVDDNEEGRDVFEAVLADGGYQDVVVVDSAAAAFSYLGLGAPHGGRPAPVNLVLLDVVMPDMDGINACARIRSDPRYADVPIIMTTSLDDLETVDSAFKCGATSYLAKPIKVVDLLACVRSAFGLKAEFERRNLVELELMQHLPFRFENVAYSDNITVRSRAAGSLASCAVNPSPRHLGLGAADAQLVHACLDDA